MSLTSLSCIYNTYILARIEKENICLLSDTYCWTEKQYQQTEKKTRFNHLCILYIFAD